MHLGWPSPSETAEVLFGEQGRARAIVDIPGQLDELIEKLPVQLGHSASTLILRHTLFPYVTAFLDDDRRSKVDKQMRGVGGKPHQHLGPRSPGIDFATHLRFCPKCASEMGELYGETYWLRDHQLPGSLICYLHESHLITGPPIPTAGRPAYIPAPSPMEIPKYAESEPDKARCAALLALTNLGAGLLKQDGQVLAEKIKAQLYGSSESLQIEILDRFRHLILPAFQAYNVMLDEDALLAAFKPRTTALPPLYYLIASALAGPNA